MAGFKAQVIGLDNVGRKLAAAARANEVAAVRAINATIKTVRLEASKLIREDKRFKDGYITKNTRLTKASKGRLSAAVIARARGTRLDRFSSNPSKRRSGGHPAKVRVLTRGGAKTVAGGFYVPLKRGNQEPGSSGFGIARRLKTGKGSGRAYEVLHTSSVHNVFSDVKPDVEKKIKPILRRRMRRELNFALRKLK